MVLTEVLSVCENLKRMGFPLPEWILRQLEERKERFSKGP